ncbi:redoxin domain-containing protein [Neobacillus mesonae]|nr:redoxin domain-containing protein [Neobacillus mesonae]
MKHLNVRTRNLITILILILGVTAGVWAFAQASETKNKRSITGDFSAGMKAPDFDVTNMNGQKVKLTGYQGKKVIMNFWASWCEPCVREMPLLYDIYQSKDYDTQVLFINVGESKGTIKEFLNRNRFDFPVIIDATGEVSKLYRVTGLPSTVTINKDGDLDQVITGEIMDFSMLELQ